MGMGVSIKPEDFAKGGFNLIDDENVTITGSRVCMFDYQGNMPASPVLELVLKRENGDDGDEHEEVTENYSIGNASHWVPSDDGKEIIPVGKAKAINDNSKFALFVSNLCNAGFPSNRITNDVSIFVGTRCHVNRIAGPKVKDKLTGKEKDSTVLVPTKIHKLPWEEGEGEKAGGKGKGKGGGSKKGSGGSAAEQPDEVETLATGFVLDVLSKNPQGVKKADLPKLAYSHESLKAEGVTVPTRNKVLALVFNDSWLSGVPLWRYGTDTQGMVLPLE